MKKIILAVITILSIKNVQSQSLYVTLEYKAVPDSFYVYMVTSAFPSSTFNLGPSQITLVFTNNYAITVPSSSSIATTGINGGVWVAQDYVPATVAPNHKYVGFQTTGSPVLGVTSGTPVLLFRFRVTGAGGNCVGGLGQLRHYVNGVDPTDPNGAGGDFSSAIYEATTAADYFTTNSSTTMQDCSQLTLPVNLLDFNARRQEKNAIVNWQVSGEDFKTNYYELYRSIDGVNFNPIAKIAARQQPGIQLYEYTDVNITALGAKNVYYRIKQFDFDGRNIASGIRYVRLDVDVKEIQVFPNPVKEGFYVSIPGTLTGKIKLNVLAADGRTIATREIGAAQAVNYYFDIKNKAIAAGQYTLQILENNKILSNKKLYINQ